MSVVVFDTEALTSFATNNELRHAVWPLVERGFRVEIPDAILAEAITGRARDATTYRTLKSRGHEPLTYSIARSAGLLRGRISGNRKDLPSAIDAIVVAHADAATADHRVVFTSDPTDLGKLAAVARHTITVLKVP